MIDLSGVVGEQAHGAHAQIAQDLRADVVFALVTLEAQRQVRIQRVKAIILQLVGAQLVHQPDAAALLAHVQHDAAALGLHSIHGRRQLLAAIAAHRAERIPGQTLGMHAHKHVIALPDIPADQRNVVLAVQAVHIGARCELAVHSGQLRARHAFHQLIVALAIFLQRLDADHLEPQPIAQLGQFGRAHHQAVLAHHLATQARLLQSGQTHEVHRGLGVPIALQHASCARHQGEHVPRAAELLGRGSGIGQLTRGQPALGSRDACGGVDMVHRHREGRLVVVGVVAHHLAQVQLRRLLLRDGHADQSARLARHQVHVLSGGELGRADHVAFVFAVGIIGAQDNAPRAQLVERFLNAIVFDHGATPCSRS